VSIDRRYASVDRIDNSIKCPHITLLIAPLSPRRFSAMSLSLSLSLSSSLCARRDITIGFSPPRLIKRTDIVRARRFSDDPRVSLQIERANTCAMNIFVLVGAIGSISRLQT